MALTKVGPKFQVTIPKIAREAIGIDIGDIIETAVQGNKIVLSPKIIVGRHPEIDKRLREALEDVKAGRVSKTFTSVKELMADLNSRREGKRKTNKSLSARP